MAQRPSVAYEKHESAYTPNRDGGRSRSRSQPSGIADLEKTHGKGGGGEFWIEAKETQTRIQRKVRFKEVTFLELIKHQKIMIEINSISTRRFNN